MSLFNDLFADNDFTRFFLQIFWLCLCELSKYVLIRARFRWIRFFCGRVNVFVNVLLFCMFLIYHLIFLSVYQKSKHCKTFNSCSLCSVCSSLQFVSGFIGKYLFKIIKTTLFRSSSETFRNNKMWESGNWNQAWWELWKI